MATMCHQFLVWSVPTQPLRMVWKEPNNFSKLAAKCLHKSGKPRVWSNYHPSLVRNVSPFLSPAPVHRKSTSYSVYTRNLLCTDQGGREDTASANAILPHSRFEIETTKAGGGEVRPPGSSQEAGQDRPHPTERSLQNSDRVGLEGAERAAAKEGPTPGSERDESHVQQEEVQILALSVRRLGYWHGGGGGGGKKWL